MHVLIFARFRQFGRRFWSQKRHRSRIPKQQRQRTQPRRVSPQRNSIQKMARRNGEWSEIGRRERVEPFPQPSVGAKVYQPRVAKRGQQV
jgi:hypothetical protein